MAGEHAYDSGLKALLAGDPVPVLRSALTIGDTTPSDQRLAFRVVKDAARTRLDVIEALVPQLFEFALGVNRWWSEEIRRILSRLDRETFARRLAPLVDSFLADEDREPADYRGLISLLHRGNAVSLRDRVVAAACRSPMAGFRIVGERWREEFDR